MNEEIEMKMDPSPPLARDPMTAKLVGVVFGVLWGIAFGVALCVTAVSVRLILDPDT
jgi:hypothetical protein